MHLKNVTLELSSKPFTDESEATMVSVCRKMFTQWLDLIRTADQVSVMLWIADGSEIFEYTGDLNQRFEWAYWCGCANHCPQPEHPTERMKRNTHVYPVKYRADAAPRPYSWLKRLIEVLRETGTEITGKVVRIGATYDNGPEFAISPFKYKKHHEIAQAHTIYPNSFVTCTARLHADPQPYAAFPDGIPEGTSVGTFLGRQFRVFAKDLGFDYLWLSNGMGFGTETWGITGMLFDKHAFHPEKAKEAADQMLDFWKDFYEAYPECVIETRGSNFSAGVEIATDACPLRELYYDRKIAPPVNSPWAALNFNTGLEIVAWMSHVAVLPDDRFPFRFYTHDPWFMNSPWLDRYGRAGWDLFLPLSISRITENGTIQMANSISLLSVDDTWGRLPDQVPREVTPLFYDAFDNGPDRSGPLLWVYPFDEYTELVRGNDPHPDAVFLEDMFIGECVQEGLPLNTVISSKIFRSLAEKGKLPQEVSILVVPVSAAEGKTLDLLEEFLDKGGKVLFYGALQRASEPFRKWIGLKVGTPLNGDAEIQVCLEEDSVSSAAFTATAHLLPQYACGGLVEELGEAAESEVRAWASVNGERRVAALVRKRKNGGEIGFVRAILPAAATVSSFRGFDYGNWDEIYPTPRLMRYLLTEFGWKIACRMFERKSLPVRSCISRHDNSFFFSVYAPDTSVEMHVNTPFGAPLLDEVETWINEKGDAVWHPGKCWHKECRCFVKQSSSSVISSKILFQAYPCYSEVGRRCYTGFRDAEVRFFLPESVRGKLEVVNLPGPMEWRLFETQPLEFEWEETPQGKCALLRHINGTLYFSMVNE